MLSAKILFSLAALWSIQSTFALSTDATDGIAATKTKTKLKTKTKTESTSILTSTPTCNPSPTTLITFDDFPVDGGVPSSSPFSNFTIFNGFTVDGGGYGPRYGQDEDVLLNPKSPPYWAELNYPFGSSVYAIFPGNTQIGVRSFWWGCSELLEVQLQEGVACDIEVIAYSYPEGITTYGPYKFHAPAPDGGYYGDPGNLNMTKATLPKGVYGAEFWFVVTKSKARYGSLYIDNLEMDAIVQCD